MEISDIKDKELRALAELRRQEDFDIFYETTFGFDWSKTPEKDEFWNDVFTGETPEIPNKPRNVNNAADNALEEYVLDTELKSIATNSHSPLHEVKEVYRCVADVERTSRVIKAADEINVTPFDIIKVLTTFEL